METTLNPPLDTLPRGAELMPADAARIERRLRALWQQDSETVSRACLFNLVVWCASAEDHDRATVLIRELTGRHPCRAITLLAEPGEPSLTAALGIHCHPAGGGRKPVCCEQISLHATGAATDQLASTVLSLLEGDLPTVLWWRENFLEQPAPFERLRPVADRFVFDTATWPNADCWLPVLAAEITQTTRPVYADLNWARLTLWRKLTADSFDDPTFRAALPRIRRVTITRGGGAGALLRAMLYAGWVAAQLGWSPRQVLDRVLIRERRGEDVAAVGLESVELVAEDAVVRLHKDFAGHVATATATLADVCSLPRKQAFAPLTEAALLSEELDHIVPHTAYERAVALAAVLAPNPIANH